MADYRQIHTRIWKDTWFIELEPCAKLLFIYLFSNERASVSGIYELPVKVIAFETDLDKSDIVEMLAQFEQAGRIRYENGIVWVMNLRKYNANPSPKVAVRIERDLDEIPDTPIKRDYCLEYGIDTVSIPSPELASEHEQEHDQEQEQKEQEAASPSADADPPPPPIPTTFDEWHKAVKDSKNRPATLRWMIEVLYPKLDAPSYGYIGRVARKVGGAGRLADLLWKQASHQPTGDLLAYIQRVAKGDTTPDRETERRRYIEGDYTSTVVEFTPPDPQWQEISDLLIATNRSIYSPYLSGGFLERQNGSAVIRLPNDTAVGVFEHRRVEVERAVTAVLGDVSVAFEVTEV